MPQITKDHNYEVFFRISSKVNQVIYSSLQIHLLTFKALALAIFETVCWQGKKCPKLQRAITQEAFFKISSKVNQVVYSSLPVYSSSSKALVPMVFEILCWQDKIAQNYKGHNSWSIFQISSKVNQVIYSSLQIHLLSFKALALTVFEIFCSQGKNS